MKKLLTVFAIALFLGVGVAYAAPSTTFFRDIAPEADSTYDLSTPSRRWFQAFFDFASTTNLTIDGITGSTQCLQVDTNGNVTGAGAECGSGSSDFPFTPTTNFGQTANATTTAIWFQGTPFSLFASSTAVFDNASSTQLTTTDAWITKLRNLTSDGFVKTSGGDGTLSIDTSTYLTGNETITLSGDVSGSGATSITTTIGADKILESMLKAVNTPVDEDILTYESTTGDFEWHTPSELSLGTVTNIATTYPILGGPITTTGTLSLDFGTTTANTWGAHNIFDSFFATNASSTNATTTSLYITGLTAGSVPFIGTAGAVLEDNTKLFWDNTEKRLAIGHNSPTVALDVAGTIFADNYTWFNGNSLTNGVIYTDSAGVFTQNANLTFDGTTLTGNALDFTSAVIDLLEVSVQATTTGNVSIQGTLTVGNGTASSTVDSTGFSSDVYTQGSVIFADTGGLLSTDTNFTWNGTTFTAGGNAVVGAGYVGAGGLTNGLLVEGAVAFGTTTPGNGKLTLFGSGGTPIVVGTSAGADNNALLLSGGGEALRTRGAVVALFGKEHSVNPGILALTAGDESSIVFNAQSAGGTPAIPTERMRITSAGLVGIGTSTPATALEVNGNITLTSAGGKTLTTPGNELVLTQTGDTFGATSLTMRNRVGSNGALFTNSGLDLVDFGFKGNSGYQSNIRYEHRSMDILGGSDTSVGEFQFVDNSTDTNNDTFFFTANKNATVLHAGNFGVGDATPAALLTVGSGDLFQVDSSGRLQLPAGASGAGNLALSTTGDTNTGLYFSGADEIKWQTGGADRLTLNASGFLGIASTTPNRTLSVGSGNASSSISVASYAFGKSGNVATTTAMTIGPDVANTIVYPIGTSATTLTLCNFQPGDKLAVKVRNPNATAGALTWATCSGHTLYWPGDVTPGQTTSANRWDWWYFTATENVGSTTPSQIIIDGSMKSY